MCKHSFGISFQLSSGAGLLTHFSHHASRRSAEPWPILSSASPQTHAVCAHLMEAGTFPAWRRSAQLLSFFRWLQVARASSSRLARHLRWAVILRPELHCLLCLNAWTYLGTCLSSPAELDFLPQGPYHPGISHLVSCSHLLHVYTGKAEQHLPHC